MKKLTLTIISILIGLSLLAGNPDSNTICKIQTTEIKGTILDPMTGEFLTGVLIEIKSENLKTYSDLDGNFKFIGLKPGTYTIETSYISYLDSEYYVNMNEGIKNVKLNLYPN